MDKRGRRALGSVLSMAEEHGADVVCLQEIENVSWPTYALSAMGWNFYRNGKVGILARRATTERLCGTTVGEGNNMRHIHVWKSEKHHSMSISIQTPDGGMMIACAYIPSGVDKMTAIQRKTVSALHAEIHAWSLLHAHSIICMDANETSCPMGRFSSEMMVLSTTLGPSTNPMSPPCHATVKHMRTPESTSVMTPTRRVKT
jgi:exonuclease III